MKQVTFNVTQEKIDMSMQMLAGDNPYGIASATARPHCCPIALAGKDVCPTKLSVCPTGIFGKSVFVPFDETARAFVRNFDNDLPVEPFEFTIDVPDSWLVA